MAGPTTSSASSGSVATGSVRARRVWSTARLRAIRTASRTSTSGRPSGSIRGATCQTRSRVS